MEIEYLFNYYIINTRVIVLDYSERHFSEWSWFFFFFFFNRIVNTDIIDVYQHGIYQCLCELNLSENKKFPSVTQLNVRFLMFNKNVFIYS